MSPRARHVKERINKWDYNKSFSMAKEDISKMKKESTVWESIFANDTSAKDLISKKNSSNSTPGRQPDFKMGKEHE